MDIRVAAAYIREVSKLDLPPEHALRSCTNAAQTLSKWAAQSDVSEAEAAPIIMEAAKHMHHIMHKSYNIISSPISTSVLENLYAAYRELRSFFFDDDEDSEFDDEAQADKEENQSSISTSEQRRKEKVNGKEAKLIKTGKTVGHGAKVKFKTQDQTSADYVACEKKAAMHLRILFCIIMVVVVLFTIVIVAVHASVYNKHKTNFKLNSLRDAMYVQQSAASTLYEAMWKEQVNVKLSKNYIFSQLLESLSFARSDSKVPRAIFYDAKLPLIEFRGAVIDFKNHKSVTEVLTPRMYGELCRQNLSYAVKQFHDAGTVWGVYAVLTPNECGNDATANGIFRYSTGIIRHPFPFVLNYRRDGAGRYVQYNDNFTAVSALTIDDNTIEEFVVQKDTLFGVQNVLTYIYGEWIWLATIWISVIVVGVLLLTCMELEVFTLMKCKWYKLGVAILIALTIACGFALVIVAISHYATADLNDMLTSCNMLIARTVIAGAKSALLLENSAADAFLRNFVEIAPNSGFVMNDDGTNIYPPSMERVANTLNVSELVKHKQVLYINSKENYNVVINYVSELNKFYIRVTERANKYLVYDSIWIALGGSLLTFIISVTYFYLSPLKRFNNYASGSPFIRYCLAPHKARYVYYAAAVLVVLVATILYCLFVLHLLNRVVAQLAAETLNIIAAFHHAGNVADYAFNANDLPSTIIRSFFKKSGNTTTLLSKLDIAYPPNKDWANKFYGAQLAMSHIFTVVSNALSFATPLVNETSNTVSPEVQLRHMIATVDVNNSVGVVLERFPSSYNAGDYSLISKWIAICIAMMVLAIFIALSEWLYLHLWEKQMQNKKLHSRATMTIKFYILLVVILSCTVLIEFGVLQGKAHKSLTSCVQAELGIMLQSQTTLLMKFLQETINANTTNQTKIYTYGFTHEIERAIATSTYLNMRWFALYDVNCSNCGSVGVIDQNGTVGNSIYIKEVIDSVTPNCNTINAHVLDNIYDNEKFVFCVQSVYFMLNNDSNNSGEIERLYVIGARPYATTMEDHFNDIRTNMLIMAIAITVILFMFLFLLGWWVWHTAKSHAYALYANNDVEMLTRKELVEVHSIIKLTPYRHRLCWVLLLTLLSLSLIVFMTPVSVVLQSVTDAITSPMVYISQENQVFQVITNATLMLKHFYYVSSRSTIKDKLASIAGVIKDEREYEFVKASNYDDVLSVISNVETSISNYTEMEKYSFLGLFATGYDSYYTERADLYATFITQQDALLGKFDNIINFIPELVKNNVTNKDTVFGAIELIESIMFAREYLRKLYVLDHISVNDDLVFTYADNANTEWPFRNTNIINADALIAKSRTALEFMRTQIDLLLEVIADTAETIFTKSNKLDLFNKAVVSAKSYENPCTINDPNNNFWVAQRTLMLEYKYIENKYMYIQLNKEQQQYQQMLNATEKALSSKAGNELSTRFYNDLGEVISSKRPLEKTRFVTGMEQRQVIDDNRDKLAPLFLLTAITYAILLLALISCYCSMQVSVQKFLRHASNADEQTSEHDSNNNNNNNNNNNTTIIMRNIKLERKPAFILFLLCILFVIPYCIAYVILNNTLGKMREKAGVNGLGIQMIISSENLLTNLQGILPMLWSAYQANDNDSVVNYLRQTINTCKHFLQSVKARGMNDPLTRQCFKTNNAVNCNILNDISSLYSLINTLISEVVNESKVRGVAVPPNRRWTDAGSRTNYSLTILENVTSDNFYANLIPYAVSSGNVTKKIYDSLKSTVIDSLKKASASESVAIIQDYVTKINIICGISDADLNVWHTVLAANRKDAAPIAVNYVKFKELVGNDTLSKLSSADVKADVDTIINAYADLVKIANNASQVYSLFSPPCNQPKVENFTNLEGAYVGTAMYACRVSNIITEQSFRELYAYNRQLVPVSGSDLPAVPIINMISAIITKMRNIITDHTTPSEHWYSITPSTTYPWVWREEVKVLSSNSTSGWNMRSATTIMQLLLTLSFAICVVAVALTAYTMEVLEKALIIW